ncbi:hypothetical protein Tco_0591949 [Tanacetum coccineum]
MPRECIKIIERRPKFVNQEAKAFVSKVSTNSSTPAVSSDVAELKDMVRALILDKKNQTQAPAPIKAVEQSFKNIEILKWQSTSTSDLIIDSRSPIFHLPSVGSDTIYLEELLSVINSDPNLPSSPVCEINVPDKIKSSCEDPPDLELKELKQNHIAPGLVTGWRVCIDYQKLNDATRKDHFPLPFMDQMLERLAGNEYYCFLDGFSGYFQIPIDPLDQEKTTFTCPYRDM